VLQATTAQRWHRAFVNESARDLLSAARVLSALCEGAHMHAEVNHPDSEYASPGIVNVVCSLRARGIAAGHEYMLLSSAVDVNDAALQSSNGGGAFVPHGAFVGLALGRRLSEAAWLAKDVVLLLTLYDSAAAGAQAPTRGAAPQHPIPAVTSGDAAAAAGLRLFLRAHDYQSGEEAWASVLAQAWEAGDALGYLHALGARTMTPDRPAYPVNATHTGVAPLRRHHGALRAALHLNILEPGLGAPAPTLASIAVAGPNGRMPELDFYTLVAASFKNRFTVSLGDTTFVRSSGQTGGRPTQTPRGQQQQPQQHRSQQERNAGGANLQPFCAVESRMAAWAGRISSFASAPAGDRMLRKQLLEPVVAPLAAAIQGRHVALSGGDVAEYAQRMLGLARQVWRGLWGLTAPHSELVGRGFHAVTLTFGGRADFPPLLPEHSSLVPAPARGESTAECRALAPCDYKAQLQTHWPETVTTGEPTEAAASIGGGLERVLRAMSGTDERLHASLQGYLLINPTSFVGMHEYLPAAGLLHLPLLVAVLTGLPDRNQLVVELMLYGLVLLLAAAKLALALVADMPGQMTLQQTPLCFAAVDAAAAFLLLPLCRRALRRRSWCDPPITAADDIERCEKLHAPSDATVLAAVTAAATAAGARQSSATSPSAVSPAALAAKAASPTAMRSPRHGMQASARPSGPSGRGAPPVYPLLPAVFVGWIAFGYQQLPLMYVNFPLFLASALILAPALVALSSGCLSRQLDRTDATGEPASAASISTAGAPRAALAVGFLLLVSGSAYALLSPLGWQLLWGRAAGLQVMGRLLTLFHDHAGLHLPILMHLQAIVVLIASTVAPM